MLPERAELGLVFGHGGICSAEEGAPAGLRSGGKVAPPAAVAGGPGGVEERRGIDADDPAMAVGRDIGVDKEVVAHGVSGDKRVEVGSDLEVGCGFLLGGPAIHAIAGQGGIAVGAGHVAEHLVVGAVFAHDQEAVLEVRQRRTVGDCGGVALNDGLREGFGGRQGFKGNDAEAAQLQRADVGGHFGVMAFSRVGSGAFALGVDDVESLAVGREGKGRRVPAHGNVFDDLESSRHRARRPRRCRIRPHRCRPSRTARPLGMTPRNGRPSASWK